MSGEVSDYRGVYGMGYKKIPEMLIKNLSIN
jgi:hypothetical protein